MRAFRAHLSDVELWGPFVEEILRLHDVEEVAAEPVREWPVRDDFPRLALGQALRRRAIGREQHGRMDVFEPVAALRPLQEIATLEELATELFAVSSQGRRARV